MIDMKYNEYSFEKIKKLIAEGRAAAMKGQSMMDFLYSTDYKLQEYRFAAMGFENVDFIPGEIREFYRIGEPIIDEGGCYKNSYNYKDNRPENGVSVVTTKWLDSITSIFFGTSDDIIAKRGIYKIRGFIIPGSGGDGEPLICPMGWAEKTRIRTRAGLYRAVKRIGL